MDKNLLSEFLQECTSRDDTLDGLGPDELYGLYVSWCSLNRRRPVADVHFRAELGTMGIHPGLRGKRLVYPGLAMVGPAATDYIVNSSPDPLEGTIPA